MIQSSIVMLTWLLICLAQVDMGRSLQMNTNDEWEQFKITYNKMYANESQEQLRRLAFHHNLKKIIRHNIQHDMGQHSYTLGVNEFADLFSHEFKKVMLGSRINLDNLDARRSSEGKKFISLGNFQLPDNVDWRTKGYVTPVKNQGQCGSCWAFSATGSLEGQHFRKTGKLVSLSEQNLVDCSGKFGNHGCDGGFMDYAFKYIKANHGIDTESSYPYKAEDEKCHFNVSNSGATVKGFVDIESGNELKLAEACANNGPISVAIDASHFSFQLYKSGVYNETLCSPTSLDHGVLVVGYGSFNGLDHWIVKNSWGETWGMDGYILMTRNYENQCGIASKASFPLV